MNKMIVFSADWCGPCRIYKGIYERFARNNDIIVERVDTDQNVMLKEQYGVRGIPTTVFFKNGIQIGQVTGVIQPKELERIFNT